MAKVKMIKVRSKVPVSNGRGDYCKVGDTVEITEELFKKRPNLFELVTEVEDIEEGDVARSETVNKFLELESIKTKEVAENLYDAGFTSTEALEDATVEQLTEVKMIGEATAEAILDEVEDLED